MKRNLHKRGVTIALFSILNFGMFSLCFSQSEKNVLIIHSYHQGLEWTDSISDGIISVFKDHHSYNLYFEYLDTKRNNSSDYYESIIKLYQSRSSKILYDAIIVSDNAAYNFLMDYRDEYFPNIPVFFCGVNFLDKSKLDKTDLFYGFEEIADHQATIQMIQQLFPTRKNLLIVNDYTLTGKNIRKELDQILPQFESYFNIEIIDTFSIDELSKRVSELNDDYVIYLLVINMDRLGNFISYNNGINIIQSNTTVPIFGSWDFYLGKGVIGGEITKGFNQGRDVAQLALQYIQTNNLSFPKSQKGATTPSLDYNQLVKFNKENHTLASSCAVMNSPDKDRQFIKNLTTIIIILFSLLTVATAISFYRKKQHNKLVTLVDEKTHELQQTNNELQNAIQNKDEILGVVAHDLRNPLSNINGLSQILLDEECKLENMEIKKLHEVIEETSTYMIELVNDLVNHSAIESKSIKLEKEETNYIQFVQDIITQNQTIASNTNINIKLKSILDNLILNIDKNRIQQTINNLLSNALRYSKCSGEIIVEISKIDHMVITSITDSGPGITPEQADLIFKKFKSFQDKNNPHNGLGLGLSIAKGIIESHDGKIYAKNNTDVGATFTFELPLGS